MSEYFKDKVALVTGSSRGVGYATACELVRRGAKVVMSARGAERLADSERKLTETGGDVVSVAGDVGVWEDASRMVETALEAFGRLDIVVNNAGVSMRGELADLDPGVCEQVLTTNLTGALYVTRASLEHVIASRGHVVFISSIAGLFGLPGASAYCAAKGGLTGLSESLRLELIPRGVHLGVAYLGFTEHDPEKRILSADGTLVPPDRPAHHPQSLAARLILGMVEDRKRRLVMTPAGKLGWIAYRVSPWLVERVVLRAQGSNLGLYKRFS
jgi:NAD(P)-dependent dehydrogenase (short-subunit alcohol dehydrogenase family)